ncbi:MAG: ribosome small subunit-dependent GTPase A [Oscillospiraceae bacterium]|nr:ribosome small subunit-dependent GTPase A [Oscillospiraceae bacterium]
MEGIIFKALSGFYYVDCGGELLTCRARGKFRHEKVSPLVGDRVNVVPQGDGTGTVDAILPRKNQFWRPAVANIDYLVVVASGAVPVTDPFLIDRVVAVAERQGCESVICFNKWDLEQPQALYETYRAAGFPTLRVSAETGEGLEELSTLIAGKVCAFTGNSGVGKSSILNALEPAFHLQVGDVSEKLGRGRHTTRHVELFRLKNGAVIADTPGFASFEEEGVGCPPEELQYAFREFSPYLGQCRFLDCAHVKEQGCAILEALSQGKLSQTRHDSYVRLYRQAREIPEWQRRSAKDPRTK